MWSQLAWFDEEFQEHDPEVREWIARGRNFTLADQRRMGEKQREIIGQGAAGIPEAGRAPGRSRSRPRRTTTRSCRCSAIRNIAGVSHPGVPLPPRFRYPQDARLQLAHGARVHPAELRRRAGRAVAVRRLGLGRGRSRIAAELGFQWAATDSGVLNRTLGARCRRGRAVPAVPMAAARPRDSGVLFRDHFMSDLIGFVYSKMDAGAAADDFLRRIRENCSGILHSGRDALVPIILDGENAWEYYDRNGRPFLRELYRRISDDRGMQRRHRRRGLARCCRREPLDHIFPGSWINANFDVWIGAEEDNKAWAQLLRARETYDSATGVSEEQRRSGDGRTADRRGQRLVLVVRAGARFRQPRRSSISSIAATWRTSTASSV